MLKPRPTPSRELVNLDGLWTFALDTDVPDDAWTAPLDSSLEAAVPASYNDQFVSARIRDHVGWVYYQRTVRVPRGWADERIVLRFDAVTHEARVYVDDALVAEHIGGYTPFEVEVTEHVRAGEEFRLTVSVGNELTNVTIPPGAITVTADGGKKQTYLHDFYNYAGIARSVSLASTPREHISDIRIVTELEDAAGVVRAEVAASGTADIALAVIDETGAIVAEGAGAEATLRIDDVKLWQPGAAYLYRLRVRLERDGVLIDEYTEAFGVRTVEVRGCEFLINGAPFYFTGFGKHEDTAVRGKGHDDAYLVHDFQLMEWIGANSFRTSHYPYAEEVLEFADRQGIVVIDETAAVGLNLGIQSGIGGKPAQPTFSDETCNSSSQAALLEHVRELIARDKNHPSVVMWSLINEPASNEDGAREYFEPVVRLARELDPTRPLTFAIVMFANTKNDKIVDLFDVVSLNRYYGWYVGAGDLAAAEKYLRMDLQSWVDAYDKPIMMTEYGADTQSGVHSVWDQPWSEEYQRAYLDAHHRVFDEFPQFVGEQVWNFADFQTSNGIHRVDGNKKGVFTRDRKPKAAAFALRSRWTAIGNRKPGSGA